MTDIYGWRKIFGVVTPAVNTVVQHEYDQMRPVGVTNQIARIHVPNCGPSDLAHPDDVVRRIDEGLDAAIERVMACRPDHLILGVSSESIWGGGVETARKITARVKAISPDVDVTQAAEALPAALRALGIKRKIAVVDPYTKVADQHIGAFMESVGYEVVRIIHIAGKFGLLSHIEPAEIAQVLKDINGPGIEAIVQFGANLPMGRLAAQAEIWLGKPVIAVNTATYWHALRTNGIEDKVDGYGSLLTRH